MSNIIRDGYTQQGYIEAVERLHDELSFHYRPMLPEQVETVEEASQKQNSVKEGVHLVASAVSKQLTKWGEESEISFESVRRLRYPVLNKLYQIIAGLKPSDPLPTPDEPAPANEYLDSLKQSPGVAMAEATEKN